MNSDTRNLVDRFKGMDEQAVIEQLDDEDSGLHIAVENIERDFNMGTIVRNANAFGVRWVHVIGRRQWNKRGAMKTDAYLHIKYHQTTAEFVADMQQQSRTIIAIDNTPGSRPLHEHQFPRQCVLVFGQEGPGISSELLHAAHQVLAIEQFGSTRSINVGVASGIAMYAWLQQQVLGIK